MYGNEILLNDVYKLHVFCCTNESFSATQLIAVSF